MILLHSARRGRLARRTGFIGGIPTPRHGATACLKQAKPERAPSSAMLRAVLLATLFAASSSYVLRFAHLPALFSLRSLMEDLPLSGLGRARPRLVAPRSDPDLLDLTLNYLGYCLMIYYLVCVCWDAATAEEQRITPSRNGSHRPGRHGPASPRSPRRSPSRAATPAPPRRSARLAALRE